LVFNKRALRPSCKGGNQSLKKEQKNSLSEVWGFDVHHLAKLMVLN
jgi:hypothetical protein